MVPQTPPALPPRVASQDKPVALWGKIGLLGARVDPPQVMAGGRMEVTYHWIRLGSSPCDRTDSVIALFADDEGNYRMRNGVFWLHDIHDGPQGPLSNLKPGYEYTEKRVLFIPSDFPPGNYHLVVGLQRSATPRREGQEPHGMEFYERSQFQTLDKFLGRGETGNVVQFTAALDPTLGDRLWPVTKSVPKMMDPRFVPAAEVKITAPED